MKVSKNITCAFQYITYLIFKPLLCFFADLNVSGLEHLTDLREPFIIASNHTSKLDPFIMLTVFYKKIKQKPIYCVNRDKKFYSDFRWKTIFFNECLFNFLGGYQVYSGTGDYRKSLASHISFVKNGYSTCIFPEGKIIRDGSVGEAKGGVMFLSQETGAPIIPVAISGISNVSFLDFFLRRRKVKVSICEPIIATKYITIYEPTNILYYKEQAQIVMDIIRKNL